MPTWGAYLSGQNSITTPKNNDTNHKLFDYVFYICPILHNCSTRQKDLIHTLTHTLTR